MKHLDSLFRREDDAESTEDVADKKSRLKEIETYLTENPADQHALLQRAELQPDLRQNLADVGHVLTEYAEAFADEPLYSNVEFYVSWTFNSRPSWLNMAEIEISILSRQCLKQRVGSLEQLQDVTTQWTLARNAQQAKIDWYFDVTQARTKLAHVYP